MSKLAQYIDDEAEHSGDDVSKGDNSDGEEMSGDDSFIDDEEQEDSTFSHLQVKDKDFKIKKIKRKINAEDVDAVNKELGLGLKKPKLLSNKLLNNSSIPPKPLDLGRQKILKREDKNYHFRLAFTNGAMFQKFLLPIASAVNELRFNLTNTPDFIGLRLEAHDTYLTLANKSRYECDIEYGGDESKALDDIYFCVSASNFMQTLGCATLKDTVLMITKYNANSDKLTFEAITNESDVQTVYDCDLLAESRLESLKGMQFNLGYHANLYTKTLKEQTSNAKKCGAQTIFFELFQAEDNKDVNTVHSRLRLGFKGTSTSGSHDFYQSAKKLEGDGVVTEWQPLAGLNVEERSQLKMERKSYNEYDNSKLRLFLNHMDIEWVIIHLCNDNSQKPLVMECLMGGKNTKHTIIVAPKMENKD